MTLLRALHEDEIVTGMIAGLVAAGRSAVDDKVDIAIAVGTAERIINEITQRADNPARERTPMPANTISLDEFSQQENDGSDRRDGISIEWAHKQLSHGEIEIIKDLITTTVGAYARQQGLTVDGFAGEEPSSASDLF